LAASINTRRPLHFLLPNILIEMIGPEIYLGGNFFVYGFRIYDSIFHTASLLSFHPEMALFRNPPPPPNPLISLILDKIAHF